MAPLMPVDRDGVVETSTGERHPSRHDRQLPAPITPMTMLLAQVIALLIETYAALGLVFAVVFVPRGILRVDGHLRDSPVAVRVLLFPGIAALWPLFAWRWITGRTPPVERNAHRRTAARRHP